MSGYRHAEQIGPRRVGGRYVCGYWGDEYAVLGIKENDPGSWMPWSITVATDAEAAIGVSRTHCTAWDPKRDRVVCDPVASTGGGE